MGKPLQYTITITIIRFWKIVRPKKPDFKIMNKKKRCAFLNNMFWFVVTLNFEINSTNWMWIMDINTLDIITELCTYQNENFSCQYRTFSVPSSLELISMTLPKYCYPRHSTSAICQLLYLPQTEGNLYYPCNNNIISVYMRVIIL